MSFVEETVGYMIRRVQERMFAAFHRRFADSGLTPAAYATLATIDRNPGVRQGRIAEELGLQNSNMVNLIKSLVERGFVERHRSASDNRVFTLTLSSAGKLFIEKMNERALALDAEYTRSLSDEERRTLIELLGKMITDPQ
ncbi:MarR family winged helix-turn-helix transcriptional regulator [Arthrobacter sp. P2b]|uniref:MarR family winged helix-turn-helix transcriptional regulator n=1 Tax=Arthrobacter sp. P2b TaxID=1938741 RepID=UPI0009CE45C4|nr:MarR family transcriptional regulator [Arthrobacter sp. P2b]SLK14796.1 DNA-binding transcriptional regulator, MarR family [Arthrobacter sp. P2b]